MMRGYHTLLIILAVIIGILGIALLASELRRSSTEAELRALRLLVEKQNSVADKQRENNQKCVAALTSCMQLLKEEQGE